MELKNTATEPRNSVESTGRRLEQAEERLSEVKDTDGSYPVRAMRRKMNKKK